MTFPGVVKKVFLHFHISILLLVIAVGAASRATSQQDTAVPPYAKFDSLLLYFDSLPELRHAIWGFCAVDINTGEIWRQSHCQTSLMPASTLKPLSTAAALSVLGPDYRFETVVQVRGDVDTNGALLGDLIVKGYGDPTLGSVRFGSSTSVDSFFLKILNNLEELGVKTIKGRVYVDAGSFGYMPVPPSWQYEDVGHYYGAGVYGVNIFENTLTFSLASASKIGAPAKLISSSPDAPYLNMVNNVTTAGKGTGDKVYISGTPWVNEKVLDGTVPYGTKSVTVKSTLPDPPYHTAFMLHNHLTGKGIEINLPPTTNRLIPIDKASDTLPYITILTWKSPELKEIVFNINLLSVNMFAEGVVFAAGSKKFKNNTAASALSVIESHLSSYKINTTGSRFRDGSGLSRKNLVTTEIAAKALASYTVEKWFDDYYNSFPVAGESGSAKNMFLRSPAKGNLRAKTGTIEGVKGLCGYATLADGTKISYALIVNNYAGTPKNIVKEMEKLLSAICEK